VLFTGLLQVPCIPDSRCVIAKLLDDIVVALAERIRQPAPSELIPMTCNEVQHLFAAPLAQPVGDRGHRLYWSAWRRRHQARTRTCHYRRQAAHL
jgi:hypothetical protein